MKEQTDKQIENENTDVAKLPLAISDNVINKITALEKAGFIIPKDFNPINAIKASMFIIQDLKDKNGVPALECCTKKSISNALFRMCVYGLDASKKQAYLLIRGNELCLDPSYFGNILRAKRASNRYEPIANIIYEGDEFISGIDPITGRKKIIKHESKLENQDKPIIGAYAFISYENGTTDVEIMTKKQIDTAWAQSSSVQMNVHKKYPDQMAKRTVINRAIKILINSSIESTYVPDEFNVEEQLIETEYEDITTYTEFDETSTEIVQNSEANNVDSDIKLDENKIAKDMF